MHVNLSKEDRIYLREQIEAHKIQFSVTPEILDAMDFIYIELRRNPVILSTSFCGVLLTFLEDYPTQRGNEIAAQIQDAKDKFLKSVAQPNHE